MVPVLLLCSILVLVNALENPAQLHGGVEAEMVLEIGDNVLVRTKRAADICKYGKGIWSPCNSLTKLEARVDKLKTGSSSPTCPSSRQITRNCKKDKRKGKADVGKKGVVCQYDKPRDADWTDCQSGVRQKSLNLISEKGTSGCPKVKVLSKKCKNVKLEKKEKKEKKERKEKKKNDGEGKKGKDGKKKNSNQIPAKQKRGNRILDKCEFGDWSEYSECDQGSKTRTRQMMKGSDLKVCQKESSMKIKC